MHGYASILTSVLCGNMLVGGCGWYVVDGDDCVFKPI